MSSVRDRLDRLAGRRKVAFLIPFVLSVAVQGFFLTKVPPRHVRPHTRWELPAIAVSLAEHGTFADPYALPTGPTAHLPPVPVALVAGVYRLLGLTLAAGYVAWAIQIVIRATLWGLLPWIARELGLPGAAGLLAAGVGAIVPTWPGHGEGLAALALATLAVAFVRRWTSAGVTASGSAVLGVACALALHVQPAILPVLVVWTVFEIVRWRGDRRLRSGTLVLVIAAVLACVPWTVRNVRTLGGVVFVRSNFGLELRMGNHDGAIADLDRMDVLQDLRHPRTHEGEARAVRELGELAYMRRARAEALRWIADHPGAFARLTASRAAHWWLGPLHDPPMAAWTTALTLLAIVGAWRSLAALDAPRRAALAAVVLAYPLVYAVVAYMPRYREPVQWAFVLLAAAAWFPATTRRDPSSA